MTYQRVDEPDQPYADAAALHDEAGQDEERHGEQDEIASPVHHGLGQHDERSGVGSPQVGGGCEQQHEADRYPGEDRGEEQRERREDRRVAPELRQPKIAGRRGRRHHPNKGGADAPSHSAVLAAQVGQGVEYEQGHADRERQRDHRRGELQDRSPLVPARGDEFRRGDPGQPGDEQHDDVGEGEATALAALGNEVEHDAHERVVAAPVGDGAADERQDRKRQSRGLVGPEKRLLEIGPRQDIGQNQA